MPLIASPSGHSVTYPAHGAGAEYARVLSELNLRLDLRLGATTALPAASSELPAARWFQAGLFDLPGGYRPLLAFASRLSGAVLSYTDPIAVLERSDLDALEPRATATSTAPSRAPERSDLDALEPRATATSTAPSRAPERSDLDALEPRATATSTAPSRAPERLDLDALEPRATATSTAPSRAPERLDLDALEPRATATSTAPSRAPDEADGGSARKRFAWRVSFELPASVYATVFLRELLHHPLDAAEDARRSKTVLTAKNKTPFGID